MSAMSELLDDLREDALQGKKIPPPGPAYEALSAICRLKPIGSEREHAIMLKVAARVAEYLAGLKGAEAAVRREVSEYLDALGVFIENYERERFPKAGKGVTGADILRHLMDELRLEQTDLRSEMGGQSVVSEILSGARKLNTRQMRALAERFHVSPSVFFDS
ncbi:MAG: transcriptional regulator [Nitrospinae bacterium]|nr:transcriptional regulator [Nitrospinota bacterium]MBF0634765.1 transcriptional regulator [Nitrospinota bacterium]